MENAVPVYKTLFKLSNGEIVGRITTDSATPVRCGDPNLGMIEGQYESAEYYVKIDNDQNVAERRMVIPVTCEKTEIKKATEELLFLNSAGSRLTIDDNEYVIPTDLEFSADDPADYVLTFFKWPFLPKTFTIKVV